MILLKMNDYYYNYYYYYIIIKNVQLPGLCSPQWHSSFENGRQVNKTNRRHTEQESTSQGGGVMTGGTRIA